MLARICKLLKIQRPTVDNLLLASGITVPTDGTAGYETGCLFQHTDGGDGTALYVNIGSNTSCNFDALPSATDSLLAATAGVVTASLAVIVDANKDVGDFRNLDCTNLDAGKSGTAGTVDIFASTASKGKFILSCADQDADTNVTLKPAGMAQACVVSIPDAGAATANVMLTSAANDGVRVAATQAEIDVLSGVTAGAVTASKGLVVDGSKDLASLRNLTLTNLDAGASGTAGSVDIFPTTAAHGKLIIDCQDQDGATNVTLRAAGMAQASVISIPDPVAATANVMLTSAPNDGAVCAATSAELDVLGSVTPGTVTASKGVVVDGSKDISAFGTVGVVNLDAGSSGVAGSVDVFPTTGSKGKFTLACQDQDADTAVTLQPAAMGQATVVSIPDPGAATANVMLTDQANDGAPVTASSAELNVLDGVTAGTSLASKGLVLDASGHLAAGPVILDDMTEGSGITAGSGEVCEHSVIRAGGLYETTIMIDLTSLNSGDANDIIGNNAAGNCHIGQITAAKNGTIVGGYLMCLETPVTADTDIDLYSAAESTGTEDTQIGDLTETQLCNSGALAGGTLVSLTSLPAANEYLYLVCGTGVNDTYSAGKILIKLWGV